MPYNKMSSRPSNAPFSDEVYDDALKSLLDLSRFWSCAHEEVIRALYYSLYQCDCNNTACHQKYIELTNCKIWIIKNIFMFTPEPRGTI